MQTLTKREKILLYVILCIVVLPEGCSDAIAGIEKHKYTEGGIMIPFQLELQSAKASMIDYGDLMEPKETSGGAKNIKNKFL